MGAGQYMQAWEKNVLENCPCKAYMELEIP